MKKTTETATDISKIIGENITYYMQLKEMTQLQLVQKCADLNLSISQASISNAIHGNSNTTLAVLSKICAGLEIEISDLFQANSNNTNGSMSSKPSSEIPFPTEILLTNPAHSAFQGYLGDYYIYFYKTVGNSPVLIHGLLNFSPSEDSKYCNATLTILTGDSQIVDNQSAPIEKKYTGQLFISTTMHTAYCQVYNKKFGELYQFLFRHWYLLNNDLKCTMACAATTCSGSNRRPTIHRICLTRDPITQTQQDSLMGQLLLNDGDIIVSKSNVKRFLSNPKLPMPFRTALKNSLQSEPYYLFKESSLSNADIPEKKQFEFISRLRTLSTAQKYNKISKRTEDVLFTLLYGE